MGAQVVTVLNSPGWRKLLRSGAAEQRLEAHADSIAAAAGEGNSVHTEIGPNRARAEVVTTTWPARAAEARRQNLTRAIDAGRR